MVQLVGDHHGRVQQPQQQPEQMLVRERRLRYHCLPKRLDDAGMVLDNHCEERLGAPRQLVEPQVEGCWDGRKVVVDPDLGLGLADRSGLREAAAVEVEGRCQREDHSWGLRCD